MTTGARRRNRRGEGGQLRAQIVDAARELLDEGGTEKDVTLRAVARRAGISAPSIYPHFGQVDDILLAVAEDAFEALRVNLQHALDTGGPDTGGPDTDGPDTHGPDTDRPDADRPDVDALPQDAAGGAVSQAVPGLFLVCDAYLRFAAQRPHLYRVMFAGVWDAQEAVAADPALGARIAGLGREAFAVLADAVSRCVCAGRSSSRDPSADATALWVGLHGLAGLRQAAPLFPWPAGLSSELITRLALLEPDEARPPDPQGAAAQS